MKNISTHFSTYCIVLFMLISSLSQAQWTQLGQDIYGLYDNENLGFEVQISDNGQVIAFGAPFLNAAPYNMGEIRIYENQNGTWEQMGESIVSDSDQSEFGTFMTLSGDGQTVAAATYSFNIPNHHWRVGVYHFESGSWQQWGDYLVEDTVDNSFGFSMKLSQDGLTLAVGAQGEGIDPISQGYAKVFTFDDNAWMQKGQTLKGAESGNDFYGSAVSLTRDGNFIAVGAPQTSDTLNNRGRIYVFKYENDMWVQHGDSINGSFEHQNLGFTVSMSDDGQTIATSYYGFHSPLANGLAQVYELQPTSVWTQVGTDIIGGNQDFLGYSISMSADGNTLVTGSNWHSGIMTQAGEVRVFRYEDSDWRQWGNAIQGYSPGGHFGQSVSLSGDGNTLVSGAPNNSYNTISSGLVQVYTFGITGIDEHEESNAISIFPNPSQGSVTLQLAALSTNGVISIVDLRGKKVYSASILQMQTTLDISDLSNGLYLVHLETNEGVRIGKLVLNQ